MARRRYKRRTPLSTQLFRLLLIILVAAVGFGFYSKWKVEQTVAGTLDDWASQVAPIGDLRYLNVTAGLDGVLSIDGLSFYPSDAADVPPMITEKISVAFPHFLAMTGIYPSGLPRRLSATAEGVRFDVGLSGRTVSGNPFEALACGDITEFAVLDLEAMGFGDPTAMIRAGYGVAAPDQLDISLTQTTGGFATAGLEARLQLPGIESAIRNRRPPPTGGSLAIVSLSITLEAADFNVARNKYCAELLGGTPLDAVAANVEATLATIQDWGWTPSEAVLDQYESFIAGAGKLVLSAEPATPVLPESLAGLTPVQIIERLNVRLSAANREPVPLELAAYEAPPVEVEEGSGQTILRTGEWLLVDFEELGQHLGETVQINTRQLRRYDGRLEGVDDSEVRIATRVPGGDAVVPIARSQIRNIKVFKVRQEVVEPETGDKQP
ncbi:MAG: hypothetical protein R3200_06935 [Xanthomonadales bacterium]|nr:hypothetical protein [Xanthomonadales bacterium]